ncbi:alpha/beta fold hydrolase [Phytomonospora endophytica]|uniref:Pimeloyl-ACP methyl ester carboxylesterase n=1 Tax=Phytomonospora endophytica TaxID=714109 RepID=A0A841FK88_9ACTN|nr:alpha/beta hydrolase [Phytomonospora endophytica]MBB6035353.1 pimeloyl-ACP methyl ester carboxylesterase [Phytomonospora endophytica]GIG63895.1 hypothetical protein Pen01_01900 [Phytomonospora endophytica]
MQTEPARPPLGHREDIGGHHHIAVHRTENNGPSVVFLPGAGLVGLDYWNVHEHIASFASSLIYDRAGTGWSDDTVLPRTAEAVARELRQLLHATNASGPHLLVGHSLGAFYARRFAQLFPDEVAGLLLLDPGHEDILDHMPPEAAELNEQLKPDLDALPDLTDEQIEIARGQYRDIYSAWPDVLRDQLIDHHLTNWRTQLHEVVNLEGDVYNELRTGGALPDVPLTVLTAGGRNLYWAGFLTEEQMRRAHDGVTSLHTAMAASVPRGEHRILDGASHQYLHIEQRDAAATAVRDLLDRADGGPG